MKRRRLRFASLDEALTDARHLLAAGYDRAGTWSLAQNLEHLSIFINRSIDGFDGIPVPLPMRLLGPTLLKPILLKTGRMPAGVKGPAPLMPTDTIDDAAQLAAFEASVARFDAATTLAASPYLGTLRPDEWRRLHCVHAAHHLGFLIPRSGASGVSQVIRAEP